MFDYFLSKIVIMVNVIILASRGGDFFFFHDRGGGETKCEGRGSSGVISKNVGGGGRKKLGITNTLLHVTQALPTFLKVGREG